MLAMAGAWEKAKTDGPTMNIKISARRRRSVFTIPPEFSNSEFATVLAEPSRYHTGRGRRCYRPPKTPIRPRSVRKSRLECLFTRQREAVMKITRHNNLVGFAPADLCSLIARESKRT